MYNKDTKYSLEEVTKILGNSLTTSLKKAKVLTISNKIIVKGKAKVNAELYFDTYGTHGDYTVIRIKIVETQTQKSENTLVIHITDKKYRPSTFTRTDLNKAGHFWTHDNSFYGYVPNFTLILKDIKDYLEIMEVI